MAKLTRVSILIALVGFVLLVSRPSGANTGIDCPADPYCASTGGMCVWNGVNCGVSTVWVNEGPFYTCVRPGPGTVCFQGTTSYQCAYEDVCASYPGMFGPYCADSGVATGNAHYGYNTTCY